MHGLGLGLQRRAADDVPVMTSFRLADTARQPSSVSVRHTTAESYSCQESAATLHTVPAIPAAAAAAGAGTEETAMKYSFGR